MKSTVDITPIIEIVVALLSALVTTFLIPYIKKKISAEKLAELQKWVGIAVEAAEQIYGSKTGTQKKEYVVAFLLSKGIAFDTQEVNALIEAEVHKLTNTTPKNKTAEAAE
ncbi:MAG: holin [Clostridia bacterium]|nr:holin [Clostridia bacterium]